MAGPGQGFRQESDMHSMIVKGGLKLVFVFTALSLLWLGGCKKEDLNEPDPGCAPILVDNITFTGLVKDDFLLTDAHVDGHCLHLAISYAGGCGDSHDQLVSASGFNEFQSDHRQLKLSFDDNDPCESIVNKEVSYDLRSLQVEGQSTLILEIDGWSGTLTYNY